MQVWSKQKIIDAVLSPFGIKAYRISKLPYGTDLAVDLLRLKARDEYRVVFDIGANVGQSVDVFLSALPGASIFAFEPFPETHARLSSRFRNRRNVECLQLACGAKQEVVLARSSGVHLAQTNSLAAEIQSKLTLGPTVEIDVVTVDEFCKQRRIDHIDLLKTDTEGWDLEVLRGASQCLGGGQVDFVLTEIEFDRVVDELHANFFAVHRFLADCGYQLVTVYTDSAGRRGFRWGNALWALQRD